MLDESGGRFSTATAYQAFLVLLGLLALSELVFSNLNTLMTSLESTATEFGLTLAEERIRLLILILLDAVAGIGTIVAFVGFRSEDGQLFQRGLSTTLAGFVAYGVYQIGAANLQLAAQYRMAVSLAGLVYALLGVVAYVGGQRFLDGRRFES